MRKTLGLDHVPAELMATWGASGRLHDVRLVRGAFAGQAGCHDRQLVRTESPGSPPMPRNSLAGRHRRWEAVTLVQHKLCDMLLWECSARSMLALLLSSVWLSARQASDGHQ